MNRGIGLALLAVGTALIIYGVQASNSVSSDMSRVFTNSPTSKSLWLLRGGITAVIVGFVMSLRRHPGRQPPTMKWILTAVTACWLAGCGRNSSPTSSSRQPPAAPVQPLAAETNSFAGDVNHVNHAPSIKTVTNNPAITNAMGSKNPAAAPSGQ